MSCVCLTMSLFLFSTLAAAVADEVGRGKDLALRGRLEEMEKCLGLHLV